MCKVSILSGELMGFVSVSRGHPYFGENKVPIKGLSYYGQMYSPEECKNLWWFCFFMKGANIEAAMQKCRIFAAQLEIEGTELGKQIAELCTKAPNPNTRAIKREWEPDDGEDDLSTFDLKRAWQNCNSLTTFPTFHNTDWDSRENYIKKVKKTLDEFSKDRSRDDLDTVIEYFNTHSNP